MDAVSPEWYSKESSPFQEFPPEREEEVIQELRHELAWVLSGMIYGYEVQYHPADQLRKRKEEFFLVPLVKDYSLKKGMTVYDTFVKDKNLHVLFHHSLEGEEEERYRSNRLGSMKKISGRGEGDFLPNRVPVVHDAIKEGIRAWLRLRVYSPPQKIRSRIWLVSVPSFKIISGRWIVDVDFVLKIEEIESYNND